MTWRLLLVEDDDDARASLAAMLEARGYRVIAAANGRDAIDRVHALGARPSLVLLDWIMPVMGGEEFLSLQPDDPLLAHVPVVMQTAQLLHPHALAPTVRAVLAKPIHFPRLLEILEQIWDERPPTPAPRLAKGTGGVPQELLTGPEPVPPPEPEPRSPAPAEPLAPVVRPPSEP